MHSSQNVQDTSCCIVGGGPGGAVLAFLLARKGVPVTLLESHPDFDRDFRGDTIHPSVMEVMDQVGLADKLLQIPYAKIHSMTMNTPDGPVLFADLRRLKTRFPFVTMMPQVRFLEFITEEAKRFPCFRLVMQANVQELVEENGTIKGVRYRDHENAWHEVRASLTVAADGRFSKLRKLAGFTPIQTAAPMDVLWYRLPRQKSEIEQAGGGFIGRGHMMILLNRGDQWQGGWVLPKGGYQRLKAGGIEEFKKGIVQFAPFLKDGVNELKDWAQVSLLSVESSRVRRWYRKGLLLIGDAAHVMSPVGGVGINYAIMDAVAAANILIDPLKAGKVRLSDLAAVQRRREWPTRIIQAIQGKIQQFVIAEALASGKRKFRLPLLMRIMPRIPFLRDVPGKMVGFGVWPVRVKD